MKLKAKDLRERTTEELYTMLSEISDQLMKFKATQNFGGEAMIKLPTSQSGGVDWGLFGNLKKNKAVIMTVLRERG